jgi:hypothetical protein
MQYVHCATQVNRLKFSKSENGSDVSVQLVPQIQSFVIFLHLLVCGFSLPSFNCNRARYLLRRHQCV